MAEKKICNTATVKSQIIGLLTIADNKPPLTHIAREAWMRMALETLLRAELARIEREEACAPPSR